jgi:hypothetical protein
MPASNCVGRGSLDGGHCCYVNGVVCDFLELETMSGRNFVCGLRRELGSWSAVHTDPRYQPIQAEWDKVGISSCGEWQPRPGECCREG